MTVLSERQNLLNAADLLERDGWRRGSFGPLDPGIRGPRCISGAMICYGNLYNAQGYDTVLEIAIAHFGIPVSLIKGLSLVKINEDYIRSEEEAVGLLRTAATRLT